MNVDRGQLILIGAILFVILAFSFLSTKPRTAAPFVVLGDPSHLAAFLDANTVVVRVIYPFSDAQGAVAAATYISTVLSAKGKRVILQSIEGNTCYTNEGNVENVLEKNLSECELNYPTISIREGTGRIIFGPNRVDIYGDPPHLMPAASFVLKKIYPDADRVYYEAMERISRARKRAG